MLKIYDARKNELTHKQYLEISSKYELQETLTRRYENETVIYHRRSNGQIYKIVKR